MEIEELLSKIGLNKKESKIYLTLLENGGMTVAGISQQSKINRPAIYKVLPDLQNQGLVVITPHGKQKHYVAESPKKLKILIDGLKDSFFELLPDLETTYEGKGYRPVVKFFIGKDGIGQVLMDVVNSLERKETYYIYSTSTNLDRIKKYYPKDFKIVRERKELEAVIISNKKLEGQGDKNINRVIKTLPDELNLFEFEVSAYIYRDRISYIDFNSETAVIIENKKIAEFQKALFKFIYKNI